MAKAFPSQAAKPLVDGLYSVTLAGSDLKSSNRTTFYKNVCAVQRQRQRAQGDGGVLRQESPAMGLLAVMPNLRHFPAGLDKPPG